MRRAIAALVLTAAALGVLLSYHSPPPVVDATGPLPSRFSSGRTATASAGSTMKYLGRVAIARQPKIGWSFGDVQVSVVMRGRRIVRVDVVEMPPSGDTGGVGTKPTTTDISNYAAPILEHEAVADQDIRLETVSGATYTFDAFAESLASALLKARS